MTERDDLTRRYMDAIRDERHRNYEETRYWCSQYKLLALEAIQQAPFNAQPVEASMTLAIDAAMVEMANISPPLRRSECERLIRAALSAAPRRSALSTQQ